MKKFIAGPFEIDVTASGGKAQVSAVISENIGGGKASGVATAGASFNLSLNEEQAGDLAFALLEAQFPALSGEIQILQGLVDSALQALNV